MRWRRPRTVHPAVPELQEQLRTGDIDRREFLRTVTLLGVTVIHRYGRIVPGEDIVLVITAAAHREPAFAAAEFLMDYLKTRAPFWKQVEYAAAAGARTVWVEAKASDDALAERWSEMPRRGNAAVG